LDDAAATRLERKLLHRATLCWEAGCPALPEACERLALAGIFLFTLLK
jgi:hypothetical protein